MGLSRLIELERVKGIEPSYEAWEAAVLPLNYTRMDGFDFKAINLLSNCFCTGNRPPEPKELGGMGALRHQWPISQSALHKN